MVEPILKKFGFNEKEIQVYLSLLKLGSAPVRKIAENANINRTTTHDILGKLSNEGLVSFVDKEKHRYFTAESPDQLKQVLMHRQTNLNLLHEELQDILPELKSLYEKSSAKPKAKYFEGAVGIRAILHDVLSVTERSVDKTYYVYSSSTIRDTIYTIFPDWNEQRITKKISVQSISIGPGGGKNGLDERKWLTTEKGAPTYTLLYSGKVALISLDENKEPLGVVVEDINSYQTQVMIFKQLWEFLPSK